MALDHFVSQVHLKNFYSPALGERMFAVCKSDMTRYQCDAKSQCRIEEGSTNPYLTEPRVIEQFLKCVEPIYNQSLENLRSNKLDADSVLSIAGFAAYVSTCAPAAMRIHTEPIRKSVESVGKILDKKGELPEPPEILGAKSLTELIESGKINVGIDPKFPQSMGIQNIVYLTSSWGNANWDIVRNEHSGSPFFTSDFPVAIERSLHDPRVVSRIVPLAPDLALRIHPELKRTKKIDLNFSDLRTRTVKATKQEIIGINTAIVRCAETTVYYRDDRKWILPFIEKNQRYRIEPTTDIVPHGKGELHLSSIHVLESLTS